MKEKKKTKGVIAALLVSVILVTGVYGEFVCTGHRSIYDGEQDDSGHNEHSSMSCCSMQQTKADHGSRCPNCGTSDSGDDQGNSTCLSCSRSQSPSIQNNIDDNLVTIILVPGKHDDGIRISTQHYPQYTILKPIFYGSDLVGISILLT